MPCSFMEFSTYNRGNGGRGWGMGGMLTLELKCTPEDRDLVIAELWEAGTAGVTETAEGITAFFEDDCGRAGLLERFSRYAPVVADAPDRDWVAVSKAVWQPIEVGE